MNVTFEPKMLSRYDLERIETKLTKSERAFCRAFEVCADAHEAALIVKVKLDNVNDYVNSTLDNVNIVRLAQHYTAKRIQASNTSVTEQEIIGELRKIAFADITDVADSVGDGYKLKRFEDMHINTKAAIQNVTVGFLGVVKVEMYNKLTALRMLGEIVGLFEAKKPKDVKELEKNINVMMQIAHRNSQDV